MEYLFKARYENSKFEPEEQFGAVVDQEQKPGHSVDAFPNSGVWEQVLGHKAEEERSNPLLAINSSQTAYKQLTNRSQTDHKSHWNLSTMS